MRVRSKRSREADGTHQPAKSKTNPPPTRFRATRYLAAVAVVLVIMAVSAWVCIRNGRFPFLPQRARAEWIIYPTPANGEALAAVELTTEFRRRFSLAEPVPAAQLEVRGFKHFSVRLNGQAVPFSGRDRENWMSPKEFNVATLLRPGTNELSVMVTSSNGLPAAWVYLHAGSWKLVSDDTWETSYAGGSWQAAQRAATPLAIRPGNRLYSSERPIASLRANWRAFMLWTAVAAGLVLIGRIGAVRSRIRWVCVAVLVLGWVALWANNLRQLPREIGFDTAEHLAYVQYILDHGSLPLATQGWEMYQPPLYYLAGAGLLKVAHLSAASDGGVLLLRIFGLVCGVTAFVLVWLSLRLVQPERPGAQLFGLGIAALLPVSLYLYQYVTNETLAATLVAAAVCLCLRMTATASRPGAGQYALLGLVMGAALLTKSSALLAAPVILAALAWSLWQKGERNPVNWAVRLGLLLLVCAVVCGWHYYRTAIHFGTPLLGNWDPRSGFSWWQEPGYRTDAAFWHFGQCLARPFYSAFNSLPDGVYATLWGDGLYGGGVDFRVRPPWNYELMSAGYLLSLGPMLAILIGAILSVKEFFRRPQPAGLLIIGVAVIAALALVYYALKVPSYAAAKAFYVMPALVPLCFFGAVGLEGLSRIAGKWRWLIGWAFVCWALNAYASFWILRAAPETRMLTARTLAAENQSEAAVAEVKRLLEKDPRNATALQLLVIENARNGQVDEAASLARQAVECDAGDPEAHLLLGTILFQQGKTEEAIAEARRTTELAPDHPKAASSLFAWLYRAGRKQEALAAGAESLRVNPFNAQFHYGMAMVLRDLGDRTNAAVHARLAEQLRRGALKH